MVPANLSAILCTESGRYIGHHPVQLGLISRHLDILKEQWNLRTRAVLEGLVINTESPQPITLPIVGANLILQRNKVDVRTFIRLFVPCGTGIHANERDVIRQISRNLFSQMFAKRLHHFFEVDFKFGIQIVSIRIRRAYDFWNARIKYPRRHSRRRDRLDLDEKSLILIVGQLQQGIQRSPIIGVPGWIDCRPLRRIFLTPDIRISGYRMPSFPVPYAVGITLQSELGAKRE